MSSIQMKLKNNVCLRKTENLKQQMCFLAAHALHKPQGPRKRTRRFIATGLWLHLRKLNLFIWMQCFQWKKGFFTHSGDFFTLYVRKRVCNTGWGEKNVSATWEKLRGHWDCTVASSWEQEQKETYEWSIVFFHCKTISNCRRMLAWR